MAPFVWAEYLLWAVFLLSWFGAVVFSARTAKHAGLDEEAVYRWLGLAGYVCIFYPVGTTITPPLWRLADWAGWSMAGLTFVGFAFCWWARMHLGQLWSSRVTRKEGHRVVDTGPYGLVRHPIYTGLILAFLAQTVIAGTLLALAGIVLVIASMWVKARLEERFLAEELGVDAYGAYRDRTPMLVPFLPARIARSG